MKVTPERRSFHSEKDSDGMRSSRIKTAQSTLIYKFIQGTRHVALDDVPKTMKNIFQLQFYE